MIAVGIDVSKSKSTVAILDSCGTVLATPFNMAHTQPEMNALVSRLKAFDEPVTILLEYTGHYHYPVLKKLQEEGFPVCVVNPYQMKKYGDVQLGIQTGDARKFKSWDEFWNAYVQQHMLLLRTTFIQQYIVIQTRAKHFAQPMGSVLHALCRKHCIDLHQPQIPEGLNFGYFEFMGLGTVIDSLAAIKKLVFEDKKLTMDQLIDALEANFEGYEDIQQLLRTAPCYGNDDEYADEIGRELDRMAVSFAAKYGKEMGINNDARYVPFTSHVPFGKVVSATPNGRVAWFPLADGSSPSHGADHNGPTAILLSNHNTKNYGMRARAARLINVKFTPKCVEGDAGTEKLVQFIRTWCDLKLWHIQFNVINADTLKKAQKDPQKYRNLIVRIAGYSAYFVDLTPDLQNDLIARTGHDQM